MSGALNAPAHILGAALHSVADVQDRESDGYGGEDVKITACQDTMMGRGGEGHWVFEREVG